MSPRISIIAACMNRPDRAAAAVANWLQIHGISEIILVDWSSTPAITLPHDPRLQILRVENEPHWMLAPAYNLAAEQATGDILLKLDVDYRLQPDFLANTKMRLGQYRHGDWAIGQGTDDIHLAGFLMVKAWDFWAAGGYNEAIRSYGHDDTELYRRLNRDIGLEGVSITRWNGIEHIPHDDRLRFGNQSPGGTKTYPTEFRRDSTWTQHPDRTWTR